MPTLLIAGPLALDDLPGDPGLLGGAGGYAAMAAAPLATTQLWARGGRDFTPQLRGILERRGIDLAGVTWDGTTLRGADASGALPQDSEPTSADQVGAVLLIGLAPGDWRRAVQVVRALPGGETRTLLAAPRAEDLADPVLRRELCAHADVLVTPLGTAQAATATEDPLAASRVLQDDGAKCVVLTAGMLGGFIAYRQKATTYLALPVPVVEGTGVGASFAGALAAWCAGAGKDDFRALKRGCAVASAVGCICAQGTGPRKLLAADRKEYLERFNRLRRAGKS
jgi:sugar/nucleoside kinase (ribokinase family)